MKTLRTSHGLSKLIKFKDIDLLKRFCGEKKMAIELFSAILISFCHFQYYVSENRTEMAPILLWHNTETPIYIYLLLVDVRNFFGDRMWSSNYYWYFYSFCHFSSLAADAPILDNCCKELQIFTWIISPENFSFYFYWKKHPDWLVWPFENFSKL